MNGKVRKLSVVLTVLLLAGPVVADDIFAPTWRGTENTLTAEWDTWKGTDGAPDWWTCNPATLDYEPCVEYNVLLEEYMGRNDVVAAGYDDDILFELDNYNNDNPEKWIRIQITYYHDGTGEQGLPIAIDLWTDEVDNEYIQISSVEWYEHEGELGALTGWITEAYDIIIYPNPDWEEIGLKFDVYPAYVDQVVIDTKCVPEPMTLSLLAIGGLALIRRRRKA